MGLIFIMKYLKLSIQNYEKINIILNFSANNIWLYGIKQITI